MADKPNVVYFHVDNLGYGELGCYGGGILRGAHTRRIDQFATEGFQLLNFAPEAQCSPSRAALLTGRHAIRTVSPGPDARVKITTGYPRMMARDAYFWAWPMVNIYNRRLASTSAPKPGPMNGVLPFAPLNTLSMLLDYVEPE